MPALTGTYLYRERMAGINVNKYGKRDTQHTATIIAVVAAASEISMTIQS
jgi:hypothetical protein